MSPKSGRNKHKPSLTRVKVNLKELECRRAETPSRIGEFLGSKYETNEPIKECQDRIYLGSRPLKSRSKSTRTHNVEDEQVFVTRKLNSTLFNFNCKSYNPACSISKFTSRFGKIRPNQAKQREKQFSPELKHNEILISEINNLNISDIPKTPTESEYTLNHHKVQLARASYQLKIPEPKETAICSVDEEVLSSTGKTGVFIDWTNQAKTRPFKYKSPQPHIPPRRIANKTMLWIRENETHVKTQNPLQITSFIKSIVSKNAYEKVYKANV